jgi:hypothetical protein
MPEPDVVVMSPHAAIKSAATERQQIAKSDERNRPDETVLRGRIIVFLQSYLCKRSGTRAIQMEVWGGE